MRPVLDEQKYLNIAHETSLKARGIPASAEGSVIDAGEEMDSLLRGEGKDPMEGAGAKAYDGLKVMEG